jgi:curved DNA-binding protein
MDYYQILGLQPTASAEEIKKAYRSLAMKHHPDRGGDQAKFKDISVAHDTLSDPQKRAEYDQMRQGGPQVRFHTGPGGGFEQFTDMFGGGFDPFGNRSNPFGDIFGAQRIRRNRDLNIQCQITLLDSFTGKQFEASYTMPSGKQQTVVINIPAGINHGETIRYQGLGDDSNPNAQRGNLNVTVVVQPDPAFSREGDDLYTTVDINPIESMIGCKKTVKFITGEEQVIDIRPGVETGIEFASNGFGFPNVRRGTKGKFIIVVKIKAPAITDPGLVETLKNINHAISSKP